MGRALRMAGFLTAFTPNVVFTDFDFRSCGDRVFSCSLWWGCTCSQKSLQRHWSSFCQRCRRGSSFRCHQTKTCSNCHRQTTAHKPSKRFWGVPYKKLKFQMATRPIMSMTRCVSITTVRNWPPLHGTTWDRVISETSMSAKSRSITVQHMQCKRVAATHFSTWDGCFRIYWNN